MCEAKKGKVGKEMLQRKISWAIQTLPRREKEDFLAEEERGRNWK